MLLYNLMDISEIIFIFIVSYLKEKGKSKKINLTCILVFLIWQLLPTIYNMLSLSFLFSPIGICILSQSLLFILYLYSIIYFANSIKKIGMGIFLTFIYHLFSRILLTIRLFFWYGEIRFSIGISPVVLVSYLIDFLCVYIAVAIFSQKDKEPEEENKTTNSSRTLYNTPSSQRYDRIPYHDRGITDVEIALPVERLIAYLIDFVISLICASIGAIVGIVTIKYYGANYIILSYSYMCVAWIGLFVLIQIKYWKQATTFGMSKKNLICIDKNTYKPLSFFYMIIRNTIGNFISSFIFYLGYIWILLDKNNQGWHDKLVNAIVVRKDSL